MLRFARLVAVLALVSGIFLPPFPQAQAQTKIVIVADEWPPFSGNDLPGQGIAIDVSRSVLERAGYAVDIEILPWARVVDGAKSGEHDAVTSLFLDEEMQKSLAYADPFLETRVRFVQRKGAGIEITDLDSLRPYQIVVGKGYLYEPDFDAADYLDKFEVTTLIQGVRMVAAGRADLTLDSEHVVRHAIRVEDPSLAGEVELLDKTLATQRIHIAFSRSRDDHATIVADFNRTLAEMQADGSLDAVLEKHKVSLTE